MFFFFKNFQKIVDPKHLLATLCTSDVCYYMAHRTATNRRRMHYLIGGTGAFQFLISNLDYSADKSVPYRYDTTPAWHEYTRKTAVERKEANGNRLTNHRYRLQRWLLAISRAGHAQRVRKEKSVIPTPCYHSCQWLVEPARAAFRWYQTRSLAT